MSEQNGNIPERFVPIIAPEGEVWVCLACGKMSRDKYGFDPITRGWDESCMLNSALIRQSRLVIDNGRVIRVKENYEP